MLILLNMNLGFAWGELPSVDTSPNTSVSGWGIYSINISGEGQYGFSLSGTGKYNHEISGEGSIS